MKITHIFSKKKVHEKKHFLCTFLSLQLKKQVT